MLSFILPLLTTGNTSIKSAEKGIKEELLLPGEVGQVRSCQISDTGTAGADVKSQPCSAPRNIHCPNSSGLSSTFCSISNSAEETDRNLNKLLFLAKS